MVRMSIFVVRISKKVVRISIFVVQMSKKVVQTSILVFQISIFVVRISKKVVQTLEIIFLSRLIFVCRGIAVVFEGINQFFIKPLFLRVFKVVCDVVQFFLAKVQQEPSNCIFHNLFGVWFIRDVHIKENFDENTIIFYPVYSCKCIRKPFPIQRA